jgi:hypothetical protein
MTIQEAVDKIKNGAYSLHMDCNKVDLLNKILITAFPNKPTYNEYPIDRWFYGNQVQGRWLGKPFNNYDAPFINLSDIKENTIIKIFYDEDIINILLKVSDILIKEFNINIELIEENHAFVKYEIKKI